MNNYLTASLATLLLSFSACCNKSQCDSQDQCDQQSTCENIYKASNEELAAIRKPLDLYVQAAIEGDSKVARPAFADGATISHAENDSLICLPIKALFDYYDATGKQPASYEISECNVAGDVAMVRIESVFGDAQFTDMFALVKEVSEWKIVSKIFTAK